MCFQQGELLGFRVFEFSGSVSVTKTKKRFLFGGGGTFFLQIEVHGKGTSLLGPIISVLIGVTGHPGMAYSLQYSIVMAFFFKLHGTTAGKKITLLFCTDYSHGVVVSPFSHPMGGGM